MSTDVFVRLRSIMVARRNGLENKNEVDSKFGCISLSSLLYYLVIGGVHVCTWVHANQRHTGMEHTARWLNYGLENETLSSE